MSAVRRHEVLDWARETSKQNAFRSSDWSDTKDRPLKRYIIEDDYDSEFRMRGRPIPPLFMQDAQGSVIYMNTFSQTISPSMRVGFMVLPPALLERWDFWCSLGPEPLDMGPGELGPRLRGGRAIKAALLDQTVLAGIGNIYADESLFRAGIDPRRPAGELSEAEADRLRRAVQEVLRESIAQCGSSIRDYRDANGNVGAFQNTFFVYGRGGQACRRCGSTLEKSRIAGRATVSCPRCQH